ncbi:50S ribosomal protein L29 [Candidatus Daviesbacteria bacterium]|nr:50S ribosomal protein L29 [Candidatus Daviesbacteria bacterium]
MRSKDLTQVKTLSIVDLIAKAKGLKTEINNLIMDKNMSKVKDIKVVSKKRKDLAQVLTVLRQKQLLEELTVKSQQTTEEIKEEEGRLTKGRDGQFGSKKPIENKRSRPNLSK